MAAVTDQRRFRRYSVNFPCHVRLLCRDKHACSRIVPGSTLNVSRGGVLFRADVVWPRYSQVECVLHLRIGLGINQIVRVRCEGKVIRVIPRSAGESRIAATIDRFALIGRFPQNRRKAEILPFPREADCGALPPAKVAGA